VHKLTINNHQSPKEWITDLQEFQLDDLFETHILARAYEYIAEVKLTLDNPQEIQFDVSKYKIAIHQENGEILGSCSCPYPGPCKHLASAIISTMNIRF